ncbi:DUF1129 family protein [Levilactobacillus bambusae]|uniref:DUF1129 domain-containing protein n=1 Tax=Levilactobacillus bambusae TaxID=2024736 RepID=A0A2V1MY37_9LACO|nr:DUF1129 family protein [Levilactobacillus bambusae]PWF99741.1 DUF1129 domain-containing protein [Levilactobacillus bambusae]
MSEENQRNEKNAASNQQVEGLEKDAEKRNAGVQQHRQKATQSGRAAFDGLGLTKRNADYMFRFSKALNDTKLSADKKSQAINDMVAELVEGQKSGKTAKNLYGDVADRVKFVVTGGPKKQGVLTKADYWPNAVYNGLTFIVFFTLIFGVMYLFSPNLMKSSQPVGIVSILVSAVLAGAMLPLLPYLFNRSVKHRFGLTVRVTAAVAGFLVWFGLFYFSNFLPTYLNPVLLPIPSIIVGLLGIAGMFYLKRHYPIQNAIF